MRPRYLVLLVAATLALAGCGLSDQQKADYDQVSHAGVSPAIYDKMVNGDPLSINDITALSRAHVNDGIIIRYIRDHASVYYLGDSDIKYLQDQGVSPSVIDFMIQTGRNYGPYTGPAYWYGPPVFVGLGFHGHFH